MRVVILFIVISILQLSLGSAIEGIDKENVLSFMQSMRSKVSGEEKTLSSDWYDESGNLRKVDSIHVQGGGDVTPCDNSAVQLSVKISNIEFKYQIVGPTVTLVPSTTTICLWLKGNLSPIGMNYDATGNESNEFSDSIHRCSRCFVFELLCLY